MISGYKLAQQSLLFLALECGLACASIPPLGISFMQSVYKQLF